MKISRLIVCALIFAFSGVALAKKECCPRPRLICVKPGESIQKAINCAKEKGPVPTIIKLAPGSYTENFTVTGVTDEEDTDYFQIIGDTRPFVGVSFVSGGFANPAQVPHMGTRNAGTFPPDTTGLVTLSTPTTSSISISIFNDGPPNPLNLIAAGLVAGDSIVVTDPNTSNSIIRTVTGVTVDPITHINTVTFNPPLSPTFSGDGSTITFLPNVSITSVAPAVRAYIFRRKLTLEGLFFQTPGAGIDIMLYTEHNLVRLKSIVVADQSGTSTLLNAQRAGIFSAGDILAEYLTPTLQALLGISASYANDVNVQYPITLLNGNIGAYIDSLAEFTAPALVAIGQNSVGCFFACESHGRLNQSTFAHPSTNTTPGNAAAAIIVALNSFMAKLNGAIIGNKGNTTLGTGIFALDRGAVFSTTTKIQNVGTGIVADNGSFVDAQFAQLSNMATGVEAVNCSCVNALNANNSATTKTVPDATSTIICTPTVNC